MKLERPDFRDPNPFGGDSDLENMRVQHEKNLAGDTTFSWDLLTKTGSTQLYNLGSEGRFYHPDFGVIRAVYVQFTEEMPDATRGGFPVGLLKDQSEFSWRVTSLISKSASSLLIGLAGSFEDIPAGAYGWVITSGPNLQSLKIRSLVKPKKLTKVVWTADGELSVSAGKFAGFVFASNQLGASGTDLWNLGPAGFRVDVAVESSGADFDAINAEIAAVREEFRGAVTLDAFNALKRDLEQRTSRINLSLGNIVQTIEGFNLDEIKIGSEKNLQLAVSYANVAKVAAENAQAAGVDSFTYLTAALKAAETARIYKDEAGLHSEVTQNASISAGVSSVNANTQATIASQQAVLASESASQASSSSQMVVQYAGGSINRNPFFADFPVGSTIPNNWVDWSNPVGGVRERIIGPNGTPAFRETSSGVSPGQGIRQLESDQSNLAIMRAGYYVLEADIILDSGSLVGAGVHFVSMASPDVGIAGYSLVFSNSKSINGLVPGAGVVGRAYSFRKLIHIPESDGMVSGRLHLMTDYFSFTGFGTPKTITWLRCLVRAASQPEIDAQDALIGVNNTSAALNTETTLRTDADGALGIRIDNLTTTVDTNNITLSNQISDEVTARTNAVSSEATQRNIQVSQLKARDELGSFNHFFEYGLEGWCDNGSLVSGSFTTNKFILQNIAWAVDRWHLRADPNFSHQVDATRTFQLNPTDKIKFESVIAAYFGTTPAYCTVGFVCFNQNMVALTNRYLFAGNLNSGDYININTTLSGEGAGATNFPAGTRFIRYFCQMNSNSSDQYTYFGGIKHTNSNEIEAVKALVATETQTRVDEDTALANQITTVSTTVGGHTTSIDAHTTSINGILGKYGITINAQGKVTGFQLIGGGGTSAFVVQADRFAIQTSAGDKTPFEVLTDKIRLGADIHAGNYRIIYDNGAVMRVSGVGFGSANQFLDWFGPTMAVTACNEATAKWYLKTNGDAYFGGALSAGILRTAYTNTALSATAEIETPQYGSNGGTITITVSFAYTSVLTQNYTADIAGYDNWNSGVATWGATPDAFGEVSGSKSISCNVVAALDRAVGGGGYTNGVTSLSITSGTETIFGARPIPGNESGYLTFTRTVGGSLTYTDPQNLASNRQYRVRLTSRTGVSLSGTDTQRLSFTSTE